MSKETDFVKEIVTKTTEGTLVWSNVSPGRYADYIFQAPLAYQAFEASYEKAGKSYELLLVHKKIADQISDFDVVHERHAMEFLVLSGKRLILTLTPYDVDEMVLGELAAAVANKNQDVEELFG